MMQRAPIEMLKVLVMVMPKKSLKKLLRGSGDDYSVNKKAPYVGAFFKCLTLCLWVLYQAGIL